MEACAILLMVSFVFGAANPPPETVQRVGPAPIQLEGPVLDDEFSLNLDPRDEQTIDSLITQLGSPNHARRELAAAELTDIGAAGFSKLRESYQRTTDFEARIRIEQIVRNAYFDYHVFERVGFLGISQDTQTTPTSRDDSRIPVGHVGIRIRAVIEGTGAFRAGLQAGDVIIEIDGEPLNGIGRDAVERFGAEIRRRGPGAPIILRVLRGDGEMTISAILGRPTDQIIRDRSLIQIREMTNKAAARFAIWWPRYFNPRSEK